MPRAQDHFFFLFDLFFKSSVDLVLRETGFPSSDSAPVFGDFFSAALGDFFGFFFLLFSAFESLLPRLLVLGLKLLSKTKQAGHVSGLHRRQTYNYKTKSLRPGDVIVQGDIGFRALHEQLHDLALQSRSLPGSHRAW